MSPNLSINSATCFAIRDQALYLNGVPYGIENHNFILETMVSLRLFMFAGIIPRPGPLVPAQSLYPMRLNSTSGTSNTSAANQNQQNQQRLGGESVYGVRSINNGTGGIYGKIPGRPESVYGTRRQDSADSSYGSYQSNPSNQQQHQHAQGRANSGNYAQNIKQASNFHSGGTQPTSVRQSPQQNVGIPTPGPPPPYLHQAQRDSPNPQY